MGLLRPRRGRCPQAARGVPHARHRPVRPELWPHPGPEEEAGAGRPPRHQAVLRPRRGREGRVPARQGGLEQGRHAHLRTATNPESAPPRALRRRVHARQDAQEVPDPRADRRARSDHLSGAGGVDGRVPRQAAEVERRAAPAARGPGGGGDAAAEAIRQLRLRRHHVPDVPAAAREVPGGARRGPVPGADPPVRPGPADGEHPGQRGLPGRGTARGPGERRGSASACRGSREDDAADCRHCDDPRRRHRDGRLGPVARGAPRVRRRAAGRAGTAAARREGGRHRSSRRSGSRRRRRPSRPRAG